MTEHEFDPSLHSILTGATWQQIHHESLKLLKAITPSKIRRGIRFVIAQAFSELVDFELRFTESLEGKLSRFYSWYIGSKWNFDHNFDT